MYKTNTKGGRCGTEHRHECCVSEERYKTNTKGGRCGTEHRHECCVSEERSTKQTRREGVVG